MASECLALRACDGKRSCCGTLGFLASTSRVAFHEMRMWYRRRTWQALLGQVQMCYIRLSPAKNVNRVCLDYEIAATPIVYQYARGEPELVTSTQQKLWRLHLSLPPVVSTSLVVRHVASLLMMSIR
jgi:hypothetical protein